MDKPGKGNDISIKINGVQRSYQEESEDTIHDSLEELKRATNEIASSTEAVEEESFDWVLPEEKVEDEPKVFHWKAGDVDQRKKSPKIKKPIKFNNFVSRTILVTVFAIILGASFGFIILKLVLSDFVTKTEGTENSAPTVTEPPKETEEVFSIILPPMTANVIQGGVFSSEASAEQIQQTLQQKSIPTITVPVDDKVFLYLGVSNTLESAKLIGDLYKLKGAEVYAKQIELPAKNLSNLPSDEKKMIEAFVSSFQILLSLATTIELNNDAPDNYLNELTVLFETVNNKKFTTTSVESLRVETENTLTALKTYKATPTDKGKMDVQQQVLTLLKIYQSI